MDLYRISEIRLNPLTCNQECHKPCIQALHKYPNQAERGFEERIFVLKPSQKKPLVRSEIVKNKNCSSDL